MTRNLNYLIARDIINIGIEDTTDFSYIIDFQSYMEKCDTEMKEYVTAHKKDIVVEIENETGKVANVEYDSSSEKIDNGSLRTENIWIVSRRRRIEALCNI